MTVPGTIAGLHHEMVREFEHTNAAIAEVREKVEETNGKVRRLELWWAMTKGALAVLARAVIAAADRALGPPPEVEAKPAVDLVLRSQSFGHTCLRFGDGSIAVPPGRFRNGVLPRSPRCWARTILGRAAMSNRLFRTDRAIPAGGRRDALVRGISRRKARDGPPLEGL